MPELDDAALERRLRGVLQEHLGALPLDLTVDALDRRREAKGLARRSGRGRGITLLAAAALLLVGGALAAGSGLLRLPSTIVPPVPAPSVVAIATASPDATSPSPSDLPEPSAPPSSSAVAPSTGVWIATGSMGTPRRGHTAVRLLDGRVLVVSGYPGDESDLAVTSAELYDPESGTWSATGNMLRPHLYSPATLLRDGKVLVVDGEEAEVYDPSSGTWTATGKMVRDVGGDAKATLLRDGKVLVTSYGAADLYDPDSGTWSSTGKMIGGAAQHEAVLLADGRVLVVKGDHDPVFAELYDPATGTWAAIADKHASYLGATATLLRDGKVLVSGSQWNGPWTTELYDPATGAWTAIGRPATGLLLLDGKLLVWGVDRVELFDPDSGTWTTTGKKVTSAAGSTTLLLDGTVLVAGGDTGAAELYIPAGMSPPPAVAALPSPSPTPVPTAPPTPTPLPTAVPPEAGPIPPGARSWKVTVRNRSPEPATLFVAGDDGSGLLGRLVGNATPNVVPPGAAVEVTFLVPRQETGWAIFVNPGPIGGPIVGPAEMSLPVQIMIMEDGQPAWSGAP
jgi:hypothetical protein